MIEVQRNNEKAAPIEAYSNIPLHETGAISISRRGQICVDVHNASSLERWQEAADHSGNGDARNNFRLGRSKSAEHTNLDTEGTKVGETAEPVRCNSVCAERERGRTLLEFLEVKVGDELIGDELGGEEAGDG